jgi:hypothetical protein
MHERHNILKLRWTGLLVNDAGNTGLDVLASNGRLEQERKV